MTKPLPSLALDMSQDGIALHQLAFDGHWHELARVALTSAALRERLTDMRGVATRLEGRNFQTRIWLPAEQIIQKTLTLRGADDSARLQEARKEIATSLGGKPADFAVRVGAEASGGDFPVAAVRVQTLHEAKTFAKSHGFKARGFSTQNQVEGFREPPCFTIPLDKVKTSAQALIAAAACALVIGGGITFYKLDPFNMWEVPPFTADFAPFQQPNPGLERTGATAGLSPISTAPTLPEFAALSTTSSPAALPYLPPRQLTADAAEEVFQPLAPTPDAAPETVPLPALIAVNWPAPIVAPAAPSAADTPPSIGLFNLQNAVADLSAPEPGLPLGTLAISGAAFAPPARPLHVANTAFFLEPLPAMATRLSPDDLAEFMDRSGLSLTQLSRMASPLLLIESKVVGVISGLPPILPSLRSGRAIPPQVEPPVIAEPIPEPVTEPVAVASTGPAPLFSIIQGTPALRPAFRPAPPEEATLAAEPTDETNAQTADAAETEVDTQTASLAETSAEIPDTTTDDQTLSAAVDAAILAALPPPEFRLETGRPDLLPRLRSGAEIPPQEVTVSAEFAEANALRPLRRPQAIISLPAPIDPMVSSAAPITATRALHRDTGSAANAARITEISASRPRVTAPVVPRDPQSVNLPSSASVARAATIEHAINLRTTNLMGVVGTDDQRVALILLTGGRIVRVQIGDKFSGWTVVAIGPTSVKLKKRNREEILRMPN